MMKFIEDIRGRHEGEEIWVVGAGSSLDDYPIGFFVDRICIGMNLVFSVFLDIGDGIEKFSTRAFYSVHEHREPADWIVEHIPHFLENCFFLLPPSRRGGRRHPMVWWEDYNEDPYYMRWGLRGRGGICATDQDFADVAKCIMERGECHYVCRGTTLHWAIQAAVVLGAKKVCVAGAEAQGAYMCKHGSMCAHARGYEHLMLPWYEGTKCLAKVFRPYGVEIVCYRYDSGESEWVSWKKLTRTRPGRGKGGHARAKKREKEAARLRKHA